MKRIGLAVILGAISICALANEPFEQKGIGYSTTSENACGDALLYIKKQSLVHFGAIIPPSVAVNSKVSDKPAEVTTPAEVSQLSDTLVKVLSQEEAPRRDKIGNYLCIVKAKLSVDVDGVIKHNLAYKGTLPAWVVVPPDSPGKVTIISKARTLAGAIARTLHKYAEMLAGEAERIGYIESLLDGKASLYVRETSITPDISVKWKRKYYMLGGKADPLFIHTFVEQTVFSKNGKVRQISDYREIESENGFVSNFEDEASGETAGRLNINKASATLGMLVDSLKKNGFYIQYQQVGQGDHKLWYVLLSGAPPAPHG